MCIYTLTGKTHLGAQSSSLRLLAGSLRFLVKMNNVTNRLYVCGNTAFKVANIEYFLQKEDK